jgi:hypothetical protein
MKGKNVMEERGEPDFQKQKAELFREIRRDMVDVVCGRITANECNRRQSESARKLKSLEQEFKRRRGGR